LLNRQRFQKLYFATVQNNYYLNVYFHIFIILYVFCLPSHLNVMLLKSVNNLDNVKISFYGMQENRIFSILRIYITYCLLNLYQQSQIILKCSCTYKLQLFTC